MRIKIDDGHGSTAAVAFRLPINNVAPTLKAGVDQTNPSLRVLAVGGTTAEDKIDVIRDDANNVINVSISTKSLGLNYAAV